MGKRLNAPQQLRRGMKLFVTFALLALVVVNGQMDVSGKCPLGQGWAIKSKDVPTVNPEYHCIPCKPEDMTRTSNCPLTQPRTRCEKWRDAGRCEATKKYSWFVQMECPFTCNVCKYANYRMNFVLIF